MNTIGPESVPLSPLGASPEMVAARASSGDPRSSDRVAADFESMMMSMLLKEMRQTLEPGALFGGDSSDSFGGIFDLYLGKHVAEAGGLGIAGMVKQYLENAGKHGNTEHLELTR